MRLYSLVWTRPALHDLKQLDIQAVARVTDAVNRLAETSVGDIKKLTGTRSYRLRVGNLRVIFNVDEAAKSVIVLHVLPRGRAYR